MMDTHNRDSSDRESSSHNASGSGPQSAGAEAGALDQMPQAGWEIVLNGGSDGFTPPPPADPITLLGDPRLSNRGNTVVRNSTMQNVQRTHGNRALTRHLQRVAEGRAVQRDDAPPAAVASTGVEKFDVVQSTFDIDATTLADAAQVIISLGDAADTSWNPIYNVAEVDGKVTEATITVQITVMMPNWPGASKLNAAAKAEWDRASKALADHEQEHVDLVKTSLAGTAATLIGKTKAVAGTTFQAAVAKLKKASKAFDVRTDHGRKTGTIINVDAGNTPAAPPAVQPTRHGQHQ